MRRSQPDQTLSGYGDDFSLQEDSTVRRFPRIGAQFQTRISKSTGLSIRPTPERMSVNFPYILEKEAGQRDQIQANVPLESPFVAVVTKSGFDLMLPDSKSNRGGLLIHKPAQEKGEFSNYVHPFMISTRSQVRPKISNEAWIQHMIHLHSTGTTGKRNRACRGGGKRKRPENEELIWSLENILDNLQKNRSGVLGAEMLGEEEATALEHSWLFFDGNIHAAQFNLLVKLSGGQATKMRKREEKKRTKRSSKMPSQQTSESWRDMYQSSTFPYVRTVLGQLQDDTKPLYVMETTTSRILDDGLDDHTDVNLLLEPDDSKGAWRSILACGKSIERQLNSESLGLGDKKPLLSTLLTFVSRAYALPTPESCFGTHHVMIEEVSNTIISILSHVKKAQNVHAKIRDKMFDESQCGIDSDDLLKFLDTEYSALPIRLREADRLYQFRDTIVQWESRLVQMLSVSEAELEYANRKNNLGIAEKMQQEARGHGYRSKALIQLTTRINKSYDLRDRILRWKCAGAQGRMTTIKTVSVFVKEAKRIKLFSPEVLEIFECHRVAEEWIDRANIAIRSKISLDEIKNLIRRGEEMSLDLTEYIDKLKTRVRIADDWLEALDEIVPFKNNGCKRLQIWQNLQTSLQNGNHNGLHELSSEGNRIPVVVVAVKLLQLALDAKNWTTKTLKWIPNNNIDSKKGKLCDLREHLDKVSSLRGKLPLPEIERKVWKPAGEYELSSIIVAADSWIEKYKLFFAGDNRRSDQRSCLSMSKLRTIVDEGNIIYANIGNSISKISRILVQAENWYNSHLPLLEHCGLSLDSDIVKNSPKSFIRIHEMSAAVEAARLDVSLDLDEAMELRKLLDKSNSWNERVALIAPKRNKRHSRGSRSKFRLKDLIDLVEEASNLPIDTDESVNRLQIQLNAVETCRSAASKKLQDILIGFNNLKSHVEDVYGEAKEYSIDRISGTRDTDEESVNDQCGTSSGRFNTDANDNDEEMEIIGGKDNVPVIESILGSQEDTSITNRRSNSALSVFRLIRELKEEAKDISVITIEGEVGELLDIVSMWCIKSFKYLNTPREVFDKRFFGAFDRFIVEGEDLCKISCNSEPFSYSSDRLNERLFGAWGSVVKDQLLRLTILKRERAKFEVWCKRASQILSDEKKLTAEKLADLAENSRHFPANRDLVTKIRGLSVKVSKWTAKNKKLFESGERIDLQDARNLVETGEKLKVQTEELKQLRAEIRAARNWSNRAKKCNVEQGSIHVNDVKQLVEEHDSLLIEMPDELEILKQATVGYCICRRPYDGFMIGCDHCEEWYHGSCIGISESKADRYEKFTCVRCSTRNIFNSSATTAVGIIRKWTCPKDLKKARQIEYQKLQRKDRKEKKDIEKFSSHIKQLEDQLSDSNESDNNCIKDDTIMKFEAIPAGNILFDRDSIGKRIENRTEQSDDPSANIVSVENGESTNVKNDRSVLTSDEISTPNISKNVVPKAHETENMKGKPTVTLCASDSDVSKINTNGISIVICNEAEIFSKLEKAKIGLQLSNERLKKISNQSQQRAFNEANEDEYSTFLRSWCLKVRSEVLAPSVEAQFEITRPSANGIMPPVMKEVIAEAEHLGILDLSDVKKMVDCFKSICWSFSAMGLLRRKPSISEVRHLISEASKFKLPDEKASRTMKFMTNRASQLQSKIEKALCPKEGESKPINISVLKELECGIRESPLVVPEEEMLRVVIEDNGTRHCTCGGPRDGKQIFFCDFCNKRFHAACMERDFFYSNGQTQLFCPCCREDGNFSDRELNLETIVVDLKRPQRISINLKDDVSPHAPDPIKLWPPFGLLQSQAAIQAFGSECLAIPNITTTDVNTSTNTQRSQILSGGSSSSQVLSRKETNVSSEIRRRDEESFKFDKSSSVSVPMKKISPDAGLRNEASQLDKKSFSFGKSKKAGVKPKGDGIQNDNPKIENALPDLIRQPSQQNDTKIMNPKIYIDTSQPNIDLPISPDTSSSLCGSPLKIQLKDEAIISSNNNEDIAGMEP